MTATTSQRPCVCALDAECNLADVSQALAQLCMQKCAVQRLHMMPYVQGMNEAKRMPGSEVGSTVIAACRGSSRGSSSVSSRPKTSRDTGPGEACLTTSDTPAHWLAPSHYTPTVDVPKALVLLHGQTLLRTAVSQREQCCIAAKAASAEGRINCFAAVQPPKYGRCAASGPTCTLACGFYFGQHCDGCLNRHIQGRI